MGYYIKHKQNYWERKVFDKDTEFDLEVLSYKDLEINKAKLLLKNTLN